MEKTDSAKEKYKKMVDKASPNSHILTDCLKAFFVGGSICCLGQFITNSFLNMGFSKDNAGMYTSVTLVFIGVFLTAIGIYDKIGKFAGAGSAVPITGFANSMAAPSIEFKKEGYILGVGSKMFIVAGPVLAYGTITSVIVGLIYYLMK